ncbi:MAG: hypothetical protein M1822_002808 [Bathelium mastoideum]|nr:MAG: hypothetical protein M1822_002808 [Bathelium mastoideum]
MTDSSGTDQGDIYNLAVQCNDLFKSMAAQAGILNARGASVYSASRQRYVSASSNKRVRTAGKSDVPHHGLEMYNYKTIVTEHEQRFFAWATGLGVFAEIPISLDAKLKNHPDVKELVVLLLDLIKTNLNAALSATAAANEGDSALDLQEAFYGIEGSLKRLQRLSTSIKHSSKGRLHQKVQSYADEHSELEFENITRLTLKYMLGDLVQGLADQLCRSIIYRRYRILYQRRHRQRLQSERTLPAAPETTSVEQKSVRVTKVPKIDKYQLQQDYEPPKTGQREADTAGSAMESKSGRSTLDKDFVIKNDRPSPPPSESNSSSAAWTGEIDYPRLPKTEPGVSKIQCPICYEVYEATKFSSQRAWRRHVDEDLEPYVCVWKDCDNPISYFASYHMWKSHMRDAHTENWVQFLNNPLKWVCSIDHRTLFETADELKDHILESHPDKVAITDPKMFSKFVDRSCIQIPWEPGICPICQGNVNSIPECHEDTTSTSLPGEVELNVDATKVTQHVAAHLKALAFRSLRGMLTVPHDESEGQHSSKASRGRDVDYRSERDSKADSYLDDISLSSYDVSPDNRALTTVDVDSEAEEYAIIDEEPEETSDRERFLNLEPRDGGFPEWYFLETSTSPKDDILEHLRCYQLGSDTGSESMVDASSGESYDGSSEDAIIIKVPFMVPFSRDPEFVGREDILWEVEQRLSQPAGRVALIGLGGVGKSQIAIEYAYRVKARAPETCVLWLYASSASRLKAAFNIIADHLELHDRHDRTVDDQQLVYQWLCDPARTWLMIVDGIDDEGVLDSIPLSGEKGVSSDNAALESSLPQSRNGSILMTSRNRDCASKLISRAKDIITVDTMDREQSLMLLHKKLANPISLGEEDLVLELLDELGQLPLAIMQAASYINIRWPRESVISYLRAMQSEKTKTRLMDFGFVNLRRDYSASNSILSTWQISFEHVQAMRPPAAHLLSFLSFFSPDGIPIDIVQDYRQGKEHGEDNNWDDEEPSDGFEEDIAILLSHSLVAQGENTVLLSMHRLVQFATRSWLRSHGTENSWRRKFLHSMSRRFPTGKYETWPRCQLLLPHVEPLVNDLPQDDTETIWWSEILHNAAFYTCEKGLYVMAEDMARHSLAARERLFGLVHRDTLASLDLLVKILQYRGKHVEAERTSRRIVQSLEKVLGSEHPETLTSLNNLGRVLEDRMRYEETEILNSRVADMGREVLGSEHPETLMSLNNLAGVVGREGKYEEAGQLHQRTLATRKRILGPQHPDTVTSLSNFANILGHQGRYEGAEQLLRQVLVTRKRILGPQHPDTVTSLSNLANILGHQGKYEEAEQLLRQVLATKEEILGPQHPDTVTSLSNLADILGHQGRYEEAEQLLRQVLATKEEILGPQHPDTVTSLSNLADILGRQEKYHEAESLIRQVLHTRERILGPEHPETAISVYKLANLLEKQGKFDDAEEAVDQMKRVLGAEHQHMLTSLEVARALAKQRNQGREEIDASAIMTDVLAAEASTPPTITNGMDGAEYSFVKVPPEESELDPTAKDSVSDWDDVYGMAAMVREWNAAAPATQHADNSDRNLPLV